MLSFSSGIPIALRVKNLAIAKSSQSPAFLQRVSKGVAQILYPPEVDVVDEPDPAVEELIDFFKFFTVRFGIVLADHVFPFQQARRRIFAVLDFRLFQELPIDLEISTDDRAGNGRRRKKGQDQPDGLFFY
jgi:hypothetical protein